MIDKFWKHNLNFIMFVNSFALWYIYKYYESIYYFFLKKKNMGLNAT